MSENEAQRPQDDFREANQAFDVWAEPRSLSTIENLRYKSVWQQAWQAAYAAGAAAATEACAKVADRWAVSFECSGHDENPCCHVRTGAAIAEAIRERGRQ